jgi:hypothetical protein
MDIWRDFFALNQTIILFIYGQVFFVLGLAITWQSRRHSRLDLARSLGWLGAFGLAHGLHERYFPSSMPRFSILARLITPSKGQ